MRYCQPAKATYQLNLFSIRSLLIFLLFAAFNTNLSAQEMSFVSANNDWNADSLGNHRAVVVAPAGGVARVMIPWRRPDDRPENKRIIVQDATTGHLITAVHTGIIDNEKGEIWFDAVSGKGRYYIYFMPYKNEHLSNYPKGVYLKNDSLQSLDISKIPAGKTNQASVVEIQSINAFNSFYPMEVIATAKETNALVQKSKQTDYLVFPEKRSYPIAMKTHLPYRWIKAGNRNIFRDTAFKGENFSYQLGIYALHALTNIHVVFSEMKSKNGQIIPTGNISCLNLNGTDYTGMSFTKKIDIPEQIIQPLWCLVSLPKTISAGLYSGTATVSADGVTTTTIQIELMIKDSVLADAGISDPEKQTRLTWLNSTLAQENKVIAPYIPLEVKGNTISLLGRSLLLSDNGFPQQIQTAFTQEMTEYQQTTNNLLNDPIRFECIKPGGTRLAWKSDGIQFRDKTEGTVTWASGSTSELLQMDVSASMEFDGFIAYSVKITALQDADFQDMGMQIPFSKKFAKYMIGLGEKGGFLKDSFDWKWHVAAKNQDGAWIGSVNAGLQYSLRDENYVRPLNTNFYLQKPLLLPTSWGNGNHGGIHIARDSSQVLVNNYSGGRTMKKGDVLYFNFTLLITPFHLLNTDFQWATRFYHQYNTIDSIRATGATVINIHHATPINPWINYPFIEWKKMKDYIDEAHAKGLKVKIYNTVRELSDHAYELFPMRSLGREIYSTGKGKGFSWLQEHVGDDYIPAWFVPEIKDAALVNSGMSRWHNYYVEGMNWLVQHVGIDGIYLDDVAFDRITMKRIKRVLTQDGHPGIIDLHSANQYNKNDGFNNSANLYMEHFPYLNRLWFGEYFDYENNDPSFFLTEVSGIPFGLMGEMLQGGGNPWRGMIYGMTNRMPWSDAADPRPLWKVWDDFGMKGSAMIGYWSDRCPVKTTNEKVLVTVYRKKGSALISVASWAGADTTVQLIIDWKSLDMDPKSAVLSMPDIKNFQDGHPVLITDKLNIPKAKGMILILREK